MRGRVEISGINTAKLPVLKNDEMTALLRLSLIHISEPTRPY